MSSTDESKEDAKGSSLSFSDVPHSFNAVSSQVEKGMKSLQRTINYLKKVCNAKNSYAQEMQKLSRSEGSRNIKDDHGGMVRMNKSFEAMYNSLTLIALQEQNQSQTMLTEVVDNLSNTKTELDIERRQLLAEEKQITTALRQSYEAKTRLRQNLMKNIETMRNLRDEAAEAAKGGVKKKKMSFVEKAKAKAASLRAKDPEKLKKESVDLSRQYAEIIKDTNMHQERYYQTDLPRLLQRMQLLEQRRLDTMEKALKRIAELSNASVAAATVEMTRWGGKLSQLDTSEDISDFVDGVLTLNGPAHPPITFEYDIPLRPADISAGRLDGSNEKSVFHKSLKQLMKAQEKTHELEDIPHILQALTDAVRAAGGLSTNGVFRKPPLSQQLAKARAAMEDGASVESLALAQGPPEVPCSLLKAWLRDLVEPLVPTEHYASAMQFANRADYTNSEVLALFNSFPDINKKVIQHIAELCDDISSPSNLPHTSMSLSALGVVFSPSFIKNPSDDLLEIMNGSKFEAKFVAILLAAVAKREEIWITLKREVDQKEEESENRARELSMMKLEKEAQQETLKLVREREKAAQAEKIAKEREEAARLRASRDAEQAARKAEVEAKRQADRQAIKDLENSKKVKEAADAERLSVIQQPKPAEVAPKKPSFAAPPPRTSLRSESPKLPPKEPDSSDDEQPATLPAKKMSLKPEQLPPAPVPPALPTREDSSDSEDDDFAPVTAPTLAPTALPVLPAALPAAAPAIPALPDREESSSDEEEEATGAPPSAVPALPERPPDSDSDSD